VKKSKKVRMVWVTSMTRILSACVRPERDRGYGDGGRARSRPAIRSRSPG
jgi:hypothetical protein